MTGPRRGTAGRGAGAEVKGEPGPQAHPAMIARPRPPPQGPRARGASKALARAAGSEERHLAGEGPLQAGEVLTTGDRTGAEAGGVIGQHLDVEQLVAALSQVLGQEHQGDLRAVAQAGEHRLAGEQAAQGDRVKADGQLAAPPALRGWADA